MRLSLRNPLLLALILAAAGAALGLRPTRMIADQGQPLVLELVIPNEFGDWREDKQPSHMVIDPLQQQSLEAIYSQTLSRTYVNSANARVMLSIAYGRDQRDENQAHKPEICYPAQGFVVHNKQRGILETQHGAIPITRVQTNLGQRYEPVTYWTTVGTYVVLSGTDKKLQELRYGLKGDIPDGILFRVSTITSDTQSAFAQQDSFVRDLLDSLEPSSRKRISGLGGA